MKKRAHATASGFRSCCASSSASRLFSRDFVDEPERPRVDRRVAERHDAGIRRAGRSLDLSVEDDDAGEVLSRRRVVAERVVVHAVGQVTPHHLGPHPGTLRHEQQLVREVARDSELSLSGDGGPEPEQHRQELRRAAGLPSELAGAGERVRDVACAVALRRRQRLAQKHLQVQRLLHAPRRVG